MITATGLVFLGKTRPIASTTASGEFQLVLLVMDDIGPLQREPWRVVWVGEQARAWWHLHADGAVAGTPLQAHLTHLRAHDASRYGRPEIHAHVQSLALAPRRAPPQAPASTGASKTTPQPAHSAGA